MRRRRVWWWGVWDELLLFFLWTGWCERLNFFTRRRRRRGLTRGNWRWGSYVLLVGWLARVACMLLARAKVIGLSFGSCGVVGECERNNSPPDAHTRHDTEADYRQLLLKNWQRPVKMCPSGFWFLGPGRRLLLNRRPWRSPSWRSSAVFPATHAALLSSSLSSSVGGQLSLVEHGASISFNYL